MALKGKKIKEDFYDFLFMHPEIKLYKDEYGGALNIAPAKPGVNIISQTIINNEPMQLIYEYKGERVAFPTSYD